MSFKEVKYLSEKYNKPYLTIHESSFEIMEKWKGFYKEFYLEMDCDGYLSNIIKVKKNRGILC